MQKKMSLFAIPFQQSSKGFSSLFTPDICLPESLSLNILTSLALLSFYSIVCGVLRADRKNHTNGNSDQSFAPPFASLSQPSILLNLLPHRIIVDTETISSELCRQFPDPNINPPSLSHCSIAVG